MARSLYISTAASPANSIVQSLLNPIPQPFRPLVLGDTLTFNLYLVDGEGNYDARSGADGVTVTAAIGLPGADNPAFATSSWTIIANGWSGIISANTQGILDLFADSTAFVEPTLEIQVTDTEDYEDTVCAQRIKIVYQIIFAGQIILPSDGIFDNPIYQKCSDDLYRSIQLVEQDGIWTIEVGQTGYVTPP